MSVNDKVLTNSYLKKRHSVSQLVVHLVFTTKYRRKLFDDYMIQQLHDSFISACEKLECDLLEMDGEEDHVHLLISYPPKLSISVMVNNLKAVSSRRLRMLNTHIPTLSNTGLLWSRSYFACSAGGVTIEKLKEYVNSQKTPQ